VSIGVIESSTICNFCTPLYPSGQNRSL